MVTSRRGLRQFLERRLFDSGKIKRTSPEKVDRMVRAYYPDDLTDKRHHQKVCYLLGRRFEHFLYFLYLGAGKTKLALDLHRDWGGRMLVLVPYAANVWEWLEQVGIHSWDRLAVGLDDPDRDTRRAKLLDERGEIVVATYQGLASLVKRREKIRGSKGHRWVLDGKELDRVAAGFDVVCYDEVTAAKNHRSFWFKVCRAMSRRIPRRVGLTGTPMDKDPIDLWAQFYLVDLGDTLGDTLGLYRDAYFEEVQTYWRLEHRFVRSMADDLARRLRHRSIAYRPHECPDMPEVQGGLSGSSPMVHRVPVPAATWSYYQLLLEEMRAMRPGDHRGREDAYRRLRQLSSGYLTVREDEDKLEVVFDDNPKLDALVALLREASEPVVVVHHFRASGRIISARLKKEKVDHVRVSGESSSVEKRSALVTFKAGGAKVLLGSPAIAYGLNLQGASRTIVFYESPDSVILRSQIEGRVVRPGGLEGVRNVYDLQSIGTVDERILRALLEGVDFGEQLIRGRISL